MEENEGEGEGAGRAERRYFDPLLDDFGSRYVCPWWERRELGRVDSPIDFRPQLQEAAELYERARSRWEGFDVSASQSAEEPLSAALGGAGDDCGWNKRTLDLARSADRFLATHTAYDLSRPGEMGLGILRQQLAHSVPRPVLWGSVAMQCARIAAEECYRLSGVVEEVARRPPYIVNLAELHESDNDAWYDRIRDVLRELWAEVIEAREYVATYLGAAHTALEIASRADSEDALQEAESLIQATWEALDVPEVVGDRPPQVERAKVWSEYFDGDPPRLPVDLVERARLFAKSARERSEARIRNEESRRRANEERARLAAENANLAIQKYNEGRKAKPTWSRPAILAHYVYPALPEVSHRAIQRYLEIGRKDGRIFENEEFLGTAVSRRLHQRK